MCYCVVGCVFIVGLYITNEYSSCRYLIQWYLTEDILQAVWYHCKSDTGAIFESISFPPPHLSILQAVLLERMAYLREKNWKRKQFRNIYRNTGFILANVKDLCRMGQVFPLCFDSVLPYAVVRIEEHSLEETAVA